MVNSLNRARALAECARTPCLIKLSLQRQSSAQFPKVNLTANPQRDNVTGYERVTDVIEENSYCRKHQVIFTKAEAQWSQHRCCCNCMHAVTGTRLFLLIYATLSVIIYTFAIKPAVVWAVVPLIVGLLGIYALCTEKHKYLYPFLIVSSVHIVLCIAVALLIIITCTAASYSTIRQIFGYYIKVRVSDTFIVAFVILAVILFLSLSIINLWQLTVVYSCMMYFEQKRYAACEQSQPMTMKRNCPHEKEDSHLDIFHNYFVTNHRFYDNAASV